MPTPFEWFCIDRKSSLRIVNPKLEDLSNTGNWFYFGGGEYGNFCLVDFVYADFSRTRVECMIDDCKVYVSHCGPDQWPTLRQALDALNQIQGWDDEQT